MHKALAGGRDRQGAYASTDADGNQGRFVFIFPGTGRYLLVLSSDGRDWTEVGLPGEPWEHVSVSLLAHPDKAPCWPEMAWVKDLFWAPEETVMQLHVPAAEHRNYHAGCLHLWRPIGIEIPRPPGITVAP